MGRAIVMNAPGGPETLQWLNAAARGARTARGARRGCRGRRQLHGHRRAARTDLDDMADPKVLGVEGAGRVLSVGDSVAASSREIALLGFMRPAAMRACRRSRWIACPCARAIDIATAAAVMMQGLTASHFATDFYPVKQGDIALVHAAAGGLGLLLTQIIRLRGGRVIGRVSSADKVAAAEQAGADHVIVDSEGTFADEVLRLTDGEGVHVVYDGSGPDTFAGSLASLRRSGTFCW